MNLESLLKDYTQYNLWANEKMVQWLQEKAPNLMEKEVASSFPSLRATLLHIWAAEDVWLRRLQGVSPAQFISASFMGTDRELFDQMLQNSESFKRFIQRQSSDFFDHTTEYKHTSGQTYEQYNAEIIQHCMQHSTYHRGQLVTMARHLGLSDPPKTDFIEYVRQKSPIPE